MTTTLRIGKTPTATSRARRIATRVGLVLAAGAIVIAGSGCEFKESKFIDWTNATRAEYAASPLQLNMALWLKAGAWSVKMSKGGVLSHSRLQDDNPYTNWRVLGENVGTGGSQEAIYAALVASKGHFDNIVDTRYSDIGVGIYFDGTNYWITQEFMGF